MRAVACRSGLPWPQGTWESCSSAWAGITAWWLAFPPSSCHLQLHLLSGGLFRHLLIWGCCYLLLLCLSLLQAPRHVSWSTAEQAVGAQGLQGVGLLCRLPLACLQNQPPAYGAYMAEILHDHGTGETVLQTAA